MPPLKAKTLPLRTRRLTLRPFRMSDRRSLRQLLEAVNIQSLFEAGGLRVTVHRLVKTLIRDGVEPALDSAPRRLSLAIVPRGRRTPIGGALLACDTENQAEIGLWLSPDHQAKGYGQEALHALIAYGFGQLGLRRITGTCRDNNPESIRLMTRADMTFQCRLKTTTRLANGFHVYAINRDGPGNLP